MITDKEANGIRKVANILDKNKLYSEADALDKVLRIYAQQTSRENLTLNAEINRMWSIIANMGKLSVVDRQILRLQVNRINDAHKAVEVAGRQAPQAVTPTNPSEPGSTYGPSRPPTAGQAAEPSAQWEQTQGQ